MSDKTVAELMTLAQEYAHAYSFVGDDTMQRRRAELEQAIRRAVDSATLSAEPAQEMTDEQIDAIKKSLTWWNGSHDMTNHRTFARAVIAADRASRLPEMSEGDWPALPSMGAKYWVDDGFNSCEVPIGYTADQYRAGQVAAVEAYKALVRGKT